MIFIHLQSLLEHKTCARDGRAAMVSVDHLVVMLTGCVVAFTELEAELDGLGDLDDMGLWDRVMWARKEQTIETMLERLGVHKASLSLMLTILVWYLLF